MKQMQLVIGAKNMISETNTHYCQDLILFIKYQNIYTINKLSNGLMAAIVKYQQNNKRKTYITQ